MHPRVRPDQYLSCRRRQREVPRSPELEGPPRPQGARDLASSGNAPLARGDPPHHLAGRADPGLPPARSQGCPVDQGRQRHRWQWLVPAPPDGQSAPVAVRPPLRCTSASKNRKTCGFFFFHFFHIDRKYKLYNNTPALLFHINKEKAVGERANHHHHKAPKNKTPDGACSLKWGSNRCEHASQRKCGSNCPADRINFNTSGSKPHWCLSKK